MFLIYDNSLQRHIGITEIETDVSVMSPDYELREETEEWMNDFRKYKLEQAIIETEKFIEEKQIELESYKKQIEEIPSPPSEEVKEVTK